MPQISHSNEQVGKMVQEPPSIFLQTGQFIFGFITTILRCCVSPAPSMFTRQIQRQQLPEGVVLGDAGRPAVGCRDGGIEGGVGVG